VEALKLFKNNVTLHFEGKTECSIVSNIAARHMGRYLLTSPLKLDTLVLLVRCGFRIQAKTREQIADITLR
jgi:hypothetical protein